MPIVFTVIHCVVSPVDHKYEAKPTGAQSCVDLPEQISRLPVIEQFGGLFTVIILLHVLLQPLELVTVTEYVPALVTVMHWVVAPVFHE